MGQRAFPSQTTEMKLFLAIFALIVAAVLAQPEKCFTPPTWEADVAFFDPKEHESVFARFYYDFHHRRSASYDMVERGNKKEFFQFIELHEEGKLYVIHFEKGGKKECRVQNIGRKFYRFGVPENATFVDQFSVGTGMLVNMWFDKFYDNGYINKWEGVFTDELCIPVSMASVFHGRGFTKADFFNVVLGITDYGVFVPPPECN